MELANQVLLHKRCASIRAAVAVIDLSEQARSPTARRIRWLGRESLRTPTSPAAAAETGGQVHTARTRYSPRVQGAASDTAAPSGLLGESRPCEVWSQRMARSSTKLVSPERAMRLPQMKTTPTARPVPAPASPAPAASEARCWRPTAQDPASTRCTRLGPCERWWTLDEEDLSCPCSFPRPAGQSPPTPTSGCRAEWYPPGIHWVPPHERRADRRAVPDCFEASARVSGVPEALAGSARLQAKSRLSADRRRTRC